MTTIQPPTGARGNAPTANPGRTPPPPRHHTAAPGKTAYPAIRTDQVAELQVIEKKVDRTVCPIMGHPPGLTSRYIGKSGSQILIQMLAEHGVTDIFGYPGGAILPTFDTLYDAKTQLCPGAPRTRRRPHGRRLRPRHGQAGHRDRDLRPRRDEHRHAAGHRLYGFDSR